MNDDPFIEYIESRRTLVTKTIAQLESLAADFKEELADLDAAMKVRLRMAARPAPKLSATVSSITEMPPDQATAEKPPAEKPSAAREFIGEFLRDTEPATRPNVGGAPSKVGRPDGIPSNYEMAIEAIKAIGSEATAPQIREYVQKKYWPDVSKHWTSVLWEFAEAGRLGKRGVKFCLPEEKPAAQAPAAKPSPPAPSPKPPARPAQATPPARPTPPAPKRATPPPTLPELKRTPAGDRMFEFRGKEVGLPLHVWRVVTKLHAAMGKGLIDFKALVDHAFKGDAGVKLDPRVWLADIEPDANEALKPLGLKLAAVSVMPGGPKAGYVLKEVS